MELAQEEIKKKYNISNIFPLSNIVLKREKIYLFYSKQEKVCYSFYTDGSLEHLSTWIDKRPYQRDSFLEECNPVKRFEFSIEDATFLLVDKEYGDKRIRNLFINDMNIQAIENNVGYQLSVNNNENIKVKRMNI